MKGGSLTTGQQQYIVVLEQSITGHKQTLDQAARLIIAQSKNIDVAVQLLENAHGRISVVDQKLKKLEQQTAQSTSNRF